MLNTEYNTKIVEEKLEGTELKDISFGKKKIDKEDLFECDLNDLIDIQLEKKHSNSLSNRGSTTSKKSDPAEAIYSIKESKFDEFLEHKDKNSFIVKDLAKFKESSDMYFDMHTNDLKFLLHKNVVTKRDYDTLIKYKEFFDFNQLTEQEFKKFATKFGEEKIALFEEEQKVESVDNFIGGVLIGYPVNAIDNMENEADQDAKTIDSFGQHYDYKYIEVPWKEINSHLSEQLIRYQ